MKHIYLITTLALFILAILGGDNRTQFRINHKGHLGYSDTENQREHKKTQKSKPEKCSGLSVSFGIVMPANSL